MIVWPPPSREATPWALLHDSAQGVASRDGGGQTITAMLQHRVCCSFFQLIGSDPIGPGIEDVADHHSIQHIPGQTGGDIQTTALANYLLHTDRLGKEHNPKPIKSAVTQGLTVFSDVHSKATGSAGTGRNIDEIIENILDRVTLYVAHMGQILHQITHGEIGGIALAAITKLFSEAEGRVIRGVEDHNLVALTTKGGLKENVMGVGQPGDQQSRLALFRRGEFLVDGFHPLIVRLIQAKALPFGCGKGLQLLFYPVVDGILVRAHRDPLVGCRSLAAVRAMTSLVA